MASPDRFDAYPGGVAAYDQAMARQAAMKPHVLKVTAQYDRGLLSAEDLLTALVDIVQSTP